MQMMWGFAPTLMLEVAIQNKVFDFLDQEGGKTVEEVATYAEGSVRGWRGVLNALTGLDFLKKIDDKYMTTPESSMFLVTVKPSFMGGILRHSSKQLIPNWLHLNEVVKTGNPVRGVNDVKHGEEFFVDFVSDLFNMSYVATQVLAGYLKLDALTEEYRVLDIAAGSGVWGIGLAQRSPKIHVTAVDWPGVIPITKKHAEKFGMLDRFDFVSGDLMEVEFPTGIDLATLGHILHSEGGTRSRQLLKKLHAALKPGGTIAIAEFTPNETRTGPPQGVIFAVNMLVNTTEGDTFPFSQVAGWLNEAGFTDARELPSPGPAPLILATRV